MQFSEDKNEMTVSQIITITNPGNAAGKFRWLNERGVFTMNPSEGEVPSKGYKDCILTYNPSPVVGTG